MIGVARIATDGDVTRTLNTEKLVATSASTNGKKSNILI
jgi:hypothetical protein